MAANARQGRHVMTQTPCDRYDLLVLVRWFGSGGSLSRPDDVDQCADRPVMRPESLSKYPGHSPDLSCVQTCRWRRAGVLTKINLRPHIKSP
jgi:hypothetical protein